MPKSSLGRNDGGNPPFGTLQLPQARSAWHIDHARDRCDSENRSLLECKGVYSIQRLQHVRTRAHGVDPSVQYCAKTIAMSTALRAHKSASTLRSRSV